MRFRKHTSNGSLRCQSDVKRNGYWTGRQCIRPAICRVDGTPLCGTHKHQREYWAAGREVQPRIEHLASND